MTAKFAIGIDLGTTNSVLAYAPLADEAARVELLGVPQLVAPGTVETRTMLPSFLYVARPDEASSGKYDWPESAGRTFTVGELARAQAAENPDRTVAAAKSWLCHSRVDRHQPILPWGAPAEVEKISPVTASRRYLETLVAAWNSAFPEAPISKQQVVLTVPASFDASARELTREAALAAGLPESLILLEEPQSAVYSWLVERGDRWRKQVKVGDTLLVCDVGGGTSDFTLVGVQEERGELHLRRVAVGNHLLVGGDNMDLALAHRVSQLFAEKGVNLDPWQSVSLWHSCRAAKETLLGADGPKKHPIAVLGRGRSVIAKTVTVDVERTEVSQQLLEGFFPACSIQDRPVRQRASGFREIGLPYESDTAITRHLAEFLRQQGGDKGPVRPTHVLFNGGVFKADPFRTRLLETLGAWSSEAGGDGVAAKALEGAVDLDHSVARGAAYYAWAKQRGGVRIRGGTPRSYYVGIETSGLAIPGAPRPLRALCVVPLGMEEGTRTDVPSAEIGLVVGEPAQFRFFSSPVRKQDQPGDTVASWTEEEIVETDSLEATLPATEAEVGAESGQLAGTFVPVKFQSHVTELGLLELWCVEARGDGRWKLEFSVRDDAET